MSEAETLKLNRSTIARLFAAIIQKDPDFPKRISDSSSLNLLARRHDEEISAELSEKSPSASAREFLLGRLRQNRSMMENPRAQENIAKVKVSSRRIIRIMAPFAADPSVEIELVNLSRFLPEAVRALQKHGNFITYEKGLLAQLRSLRGLPAEDYNELAHALAKSDHIQAFSALPRVAASPWVSSSAKDCAKTALAKRSNPNADTPTSERSGVPMYRRLSSVAGRAALCASLEGYRQMLAMARGGTGNFRDQACCFPFGQSLRAVRL